VSKFLNVVAFLHAARYVTELLSHTAMCRIPGGSAASTPRRDRYMSKREANGMPKFDDAPLFLRF
jgi:hypothetical protein